QRLRPMQVIAIALPTGAIVFLSVALVIVANRARGWAPPDHPPWLTWVAVGMVALQAVLTSVLPASQTWSVLRRIAAGSWRPPPGSPSEAFGTDTALLLGVRQTELLIGLAPLEGAAFLGCCAYLVEGRPAAL